MPGVTPHHEEVVSFAARHPEVIEKAIASGSANCVEGFLNRVEDVHRLGLEMEAATIGEVAKQCGIREWIVIKGVMDHADPNKADRFKPFAARASAEALRNFLIGRFSV